MQRGITVHKGRETLGLGVFFGFHLDGDNPVARLDEEIKQKTAFLMKAASMGYEGGFASFTSAAAYLCSSMMILIINLSIKSQHQ